MIGRMILVLASLLLVLTSCGGDATDRSPATSSAPAAPGGTSAPDELPCGTDGYPCTYAEIDPAVLEVQASYAAEAVRMLDSESRDDAFRWIEAQPGVVESHLSETLLMFRLEGAMPMSIITPVGPAGGGQIGSIVPAGLADPELPAMQLASAVVERPTERSPRTADVVGVGTDREHPQNLKHALFLEPWASAEGTLFSAASRVDPNELLGEVKPDYSHPEAITHERDGDVTPDLFSPDTWRHYDFVYVSTHGGTWPEGAVLETGVRADWDGQEATYQPTCDRIIDEYDAYRGVACGIQHANGRSFVTVDVTDLFFLVHFLGEGRQLEKTIVVIEACESLKYPHLARAIVGVSSAYFGWTDYINLDDAREASGQLLVQLTGKGRRGKTAGAALETLCDLGQCGGDRFRDPTASGNPPWLRLFNNGAAARELRLYALPTPRDPNDPAAILEDGAELRVRGTPGDGAHDRLEVTVDVVGVIDPEETGGGGGSLDDIVLASSHGAASAAELYDLHVFIGDERIGSDNLGDPQESAEVEQLDETTYRYTNTFALPFDVDPDGTDTTLRVVVDLPEGGVSDYEIGVVLVGGSYALITVGNTTWEFQASQNWVCIAEEASIIVGDFRADGTGFSAILHADGTGNIVVSDDGLGEQWEALADRQGTTVLWMLPEGSSQIDTITMDEGHAWGQATFIEINAVHAAWQENSESPDWPPSVPGTFDILCGNYFEED